MDSTPSHTTNPKHGSSHTSIDPDEIDKFRRIADQWWDAEGPFAPLHKFNPARLDLITTHLRTHFKKAKSEPLPFKRLRVLDIGCGGGLVSEPMARLGGHVTGLDAGDRNIGAARIHAQQAGLDIDYRIGTAEGLLAQKPEPFDIILNLEVVEHVANPEPFLQDCTQLLAPGGCMAVATINRTAKAFILAILGAEYVLGWLPKGTHQFSNLVRPAEAIAPLEQAGLSVSAPIGLHYNPLRDHWFQSADAAVNYMLFAAAPA